MKELNHLTKYTIEISYQELRDLQSICNDYIIMNPNAKNSNGGAKYEYEKCEKYYYEIDKIINKEYKK